MRFPGSSLNPVRAFLTGGSDDERQAERRELGYWRR